MSFTVDIVNLAEFTAGDNSLLGNVDAPVQLSAMGLLTNTTASSSSSSTLGSSSLVLAATAQNLPVELKLPYILRLSLSAYTSGSIYGLISA